MDGTSHNTSRGPIHLEPRLKYRINFKNSNEESYRALQVHWAPQLKDVCNGQLRLVSYTNQPSDACLMMFVLFHWPPSDQWDETSEVVEVTVPATVTFLRPFTASESSRGSTLWTFGNPRKNIAWVYPERAYSGLVHYRLALTDVGSTEIDPDSQLASHHANKALHFGQYFTTEIQHIVDEHGDVLAIDLDDTRGRLVLLMSDGELVVMEYI